MKQELYGWTVILAGIYVFQSALRFCQHGCILPRLRWRSGREGSLRRSFGEVSILPF